jgi:hypothetical protein
MFNKRRNNVFYLLHNLQINFNIVLIKIKKELYLHPHFE